jgi:hypothetical protein
MGGAVTVVEDVVNLAVVVIAVPALISAVHPMTLVLYARPSI